MQVISLCRTSCVAAPAVRSTTKKPPAGEAGSKSGQD
jgi:hypothetical protein